MLNTLIIGYGIVGHNLYKELETIKPHIIDKYKPPEYPAESNHIFFKSILIHALSLQKSKLILQHITYIINYFLY